VSETLVDILPPNFRVFALLVLILILDMSATTVISQLKVLVEKAGRLRERLQQVRPIDD
jgi:hypothetical protein